MVVVEKCWIVMIDILICFSMENKEATDRLVYVSLQKYRMQWSIHSIQPIKYLFYIDINISN